MIFLSDLIDIICLLSGNVAYNKKAHQLGTYRDHVAPRAVDGDIGPGLGGGHCAHPADDLNKEAAWWSVVLGDLYQITDIVFFARDGYYG